MLAMQLARVGLVEDVIAFGQRQQTPQGPSLVNFGRRCSGRCPLRLISWQNSSITKGAGTSMCRSALSQRLRIDLRLTSAPSG